MSDFDIERLLGRVIQVAFTVPDIRQAMESYSRELRIGPWFYFEHLPAVEQIHRGRSVQFDLAVALAYGGPGCRTMYELIQQHDAAPSVYSEVIESRGHGFHHYGIATRQFDEDVARHRRRGHELIFSARTPRGNRGAYMEAPEILGGLIEYIEVTAASEEFYGRMYAAALAFDGSDSVHRLA
jgi:hypothetical protein